MNPSEPASLAISVDDVHAAAIRIAPHVVRTPARTSTSIDELVGCNVWFKCEPLQTTGSFKFRGACNAVAALSEEQRTAGVVTWSSGNHGQAIAAAAALFGSSAVIVMPHDAPRLKVEATARRGARIVHYDRYAQDRVAVGRAIAAAENRVAIPPFDWPDVMAGQGTAALEFFDQAPPLSSLAVCLGGGGLLAGSATVANAVSPATRIYGVEPRAGDDHLRSRVAGERVEIDVPVTIADGQQTTAPGELTWPITNALTTDFVTVTDDQISRAMAILDTHLGLMVEPSGASAFAAVLAREVPVSADDRIGVTISGGNVDIDRHRELIAPWR